MNEVHVLHVLCDPLKETQRLIEGDGHGDLGQLLEGAGKTHHQWAHAHPARSTGKMLALLFRGKEVNYGQTPLLTGSRGHTQTRLGARLGGKRPPGDPAAEHNCTCIYSWV